MDPLTAGVSLATAGIGTLGSIFGGGGGGGKTAGVGMTPYKVINMPTYPWQGPTLKTAADFVQSGLRGLTEGELPQWWQKYSEPVRRGLRRGVEETFYGSQGLSPALGVMDQVRSAGAATGIGPKSTMAYTAKAMKDYMTKRQEIDEYLASKALSYGEQASFKYPWMAAQVGAISPPAQVVGGEPYNIPAQADPWLQGIEAISGVLPYMDMFGGQEESAVTTTDWAHPNYWEPRMKAPVGQSYEEGMYNAQFPAYYSSNITPYNPEIPWEQVAPYNPLTGEPVYI